jgi:dihydroflavonol-4-reductase
MTKIFVTGASGFIGSRVVHFLIHAGYQVKALLRETSNPKRLAHLLFETCVGDILDPASLIEGMQDCDGVMHLASLSNWSDIHSPKMAHVVIQGSKNVFQAAARKNLKVVYVSSSTAINGTNHPLIQKEDAAFNLDQSGYVYAWAKHQVEKLCLDAVTQGQNIVIVNPAEVFGPHDYDQITCGNLRDFVRSNPVLVCSGGTSVVHVDDVAQGIIAAYEKGEKGERYFLGGENLSVKELAELTLSLINKEKKILTFNNRLILFLAKIGKKTKLPLPFNPHVIPYATKYWYFDNKKAREKLGVSFRSARETLQDTLSWMKSENIIN